jgi:hypothetical protein
MGTLPPQVTHPNAFMYCLFAVNIANLLALPSPNFPRNMRRIPDTTDKFFRAWKTDKY